QPAFATQPRAAALARGATIVLGAEQAPARVRASPGQQWAAFSSEAQTRLFGEPYGVAVDSDRMGYRLQGPSLALRAPLEMISQAVAFGTVQVPPDGQPIVLMADRQTAGGYPKIAAVASVDLPILAQRLPRERVSFERIELAEAQALILQREREFDAIRESTEQLGQN
ncbi:MAG: hypothetical protein KJZ83_21135, partial [Burkholderiaceae bacterium]|nr:hypothetical protein [Burkholderiaceae bacterium]